VIPFGLSDYYKGNVLRIGGNIFSNSCVKLHIERNNINLTGEFKYSNLTPLKYDIMGPFCCLPMECRHGIISMKHDVSGEIILNGEKFIFDKGIGYIETDSGHSFPKRYSWVQSNDFRRNCSIMASVAKIPFTGLPCIRRTAWARNRLFFWGCICVIWLDGKEYRLATYKGAKATRLKHGKMEIRQGIYHLSITINRRKAHRLLAPLNGSMTRTIKESVSCPARFVFKKNGKIIFDEVSDYASYEYAGK
jgi:hypothetical protein